MERLRKPGSVRSIRPPPRSNGACWATDQLRSSSVAPWSQRRWRPGGRP